MTGSAAAEIEEWLGTSLVDEGELDVDIIGWSDRRQIYLEGDFDFDVIGMRWFCSNSTVEFVPFKDSTGGCSLVYKRVLETDNAYGIVDRDYLLKYDTVDLFLESDDYDFISCVKRIHSRLLVLTHHELETLLVDVPSLTQILLNRKAIKRGEENGVVRKLANIIKKLILIEAAAINFRLCGISKEDSFDSRFCCGDSLSKVPSAIEKQIRKLDAELPTERIRNCTFEVQEYLFELVGSEMTEDEVVSTLIRFVDGKRLLGHICNAYKLGDDIEFDLADNMKRLNRIPDYLTSFITEGKVN